MRVNYGELKDRARLLQSLTGLTPIEFEDLLPSLRRLGQALSKLPLSKSLANANGAQAAKQNSLLSKTSFYSSWCTSVSIQRRKCKAICLA